jgi:hypothetical protein
MLKQSEGPKEEDVLGGYYVASLLYPTSRQPTDGDKPEALAAAHWPLSHHPPRANTRRASHGSLHRYTHAASDKPVADHAIVGGATLCNETPTPYREKARHGPHSR